MITRSPLAAGPARPASHPIVPKSLEAPALVILSASRRTPRPPKYGSTTNPRRPLPRFRPCEAVLRLPLILLLIIILILTAFTSPPAAAQTPTGVPYDIVYSRAPRAGDTSFVDLPEVFYPIEIAAGTDLMLLRPDGTEEVLVSSDTDGDGSNRGAIVDPMVSFDGLWVYYVQFHDQTNLQGQRPGDPSREGADIYKIHLQTREIVRLTHQEWTPNTGVVTWSNNHLNAQPSGTWYLGYGVFNLGPCPLPDGRIVFSSSRNNYFPNKTFTNPCFQLFVMDNDGANVECIGHLNLGSALHPTVLTDGRIMFSSYEAQGLRDNRLWGLWAIWPDGTNWEPLLSPFTKQNAFHFQTQLTNGDIAVADYYNLNNKGFGTVLAFPSVKNPTLPPFGSPFPGHSSNPSVRRGIWWFQPGHPSHMQPRYRKYPFSPPGLYALSAFSHSDDNASSFNLSGTYAGKVTHPAAAPNNDVLLTYSPGPANSLNRPTKYPAYDAGIAMIVGGTPVTDEAAMLMIKNDPAYNEIQPRPVVTYKDIYGIDTPAVIPRYKNDGSSHASLEPGTPFGLVGTSSFYKRDVTPAETGNGFSGYDAFNTNQNQKDSNWSWQGAVAGKYTDSDIYAVRILSMEPSSNVSYGPGIGNSWIRGFKNHATERLRILGEIPLRKTDETGGTVIDPEGNPDTSFLARIPADTPFTFQTLDDNGMVLNMSQTWHQVRPGETRVDCGGCHAHSKVGLPFAGTAASQPDYHILDTALKTPLLSKDGSGNTILVEDPAQAVDVEYYRDVQPILQRSCVGCHSPSNPASPGNPAGELDLTLTSGGNYDGSYNRLANDSSATWGIPPIISTNSWRNNNASRYVRKFQSRRSLLMWKIWGQRLDGISNSAHPTESTPGDPNTLPPGAGPNDADIDYTGEMMPPPSSDPVTYPRLTYDEKMLIARWIDLGAPASSRGGGVQQLLGWFADELRPTIDCSLPQPGRSLMPLTTIRLGLFDYYTGLDMTNFSVTCSHEIDGIPAGTELAGNFSLSGDHVWTWPLSEAIIQTNGWCTLTISITDISGNIHTMDRTFAIGPNLQPPALATDGTEPSTGAQRLHFTADPGDQLMLQMNPTLDPNNWIDYQQILDFDGAQYALDEDAPSYDKTFYRIKRVSP
ncbi:MAG: hypothetical protein AAF591_19890 [Verrucomicrobiota bacterium]